MRKKFTREEYKEKFEKLCFIYQDGEVIVQAKEPYPQYWFVSNKGYVISIHGRKVKKITPIVYLSKQADDPKDIECKAHPIKAVVLQE